MSEKTVRKVIKEAEFDIFLDMVENGNIPDTWELVAEAIGVHKNTITEWRKRPEFQRAKAQGVENALKNMEVAGKKDWKMWREKLNLLGATKPQDQTNIQVVVPIFNVMSDDAKKQLEKLYERSDSTNN